MIVDLFIFSIVKCFSFQFHSLLSQITCTHQTKPKQTTTTSKNTIIFTLKILKLFYKNFEKLFFSSPKACRNKNWMDGICDTNFCQGLKMMAISWLGIVALSPPPPTTTFTTPTNDQFPLTFILSPYQTRRN